MSSTIRRLCPCAAGLAAVAFLTGLLAPAPGMELYWAFDETAGTVALDDSGNTHDGNYLNGAARSTALMPPVAFTYGNVSSVSLDGTNDYVSVPDDPALRLTGDFSVSFWVRKTAEATDWARIVGKGNGTHRMFGVWEWAGADQRLLFQQYNNGASRLELASATPLERDRWYHIVCTVQGSTARIHMNGQPDVQGSRSGPPSVSADPFTVGYAGFHTHFQGQVDDVRLYNRALTQEEIDILYMGVPMPSGVAVQPGIQQITVSWTPPAQPPGYPYVYNIYRSMNGGAFQKIATGVSGTSYTDTTAVSGNGTDSFVYQVSAVSAAESGRAPSIAVTPLLPTPRTDDNDEGIFEDRCACGSRARGSVPAALAAVLALGLCVAARRAC